MNGLTTTLRLLRAHKACASRYAHLRRALGEGYGDNTSITIERILDLNGMDDALWALQATEQPEEAERLARLIACDFACSTPLRDGRVTYDLLTNERSRRAIEVAHAFAYGGASQTELIAASAAAWDAARAAAWDASWDAAREWQTACLRRWLAAPEPPGEEGT